MEEQFNQFVNENKSILNNNDDNTDRICDCTLTYNVEILDFIDTYLKPTKTFNNLSPDNWTLQKYCITYLKKIKNIDEYIDDCNLTMHLLFRNYKYKVINNNMLVHCKRFKFAVSQKSMSNLYKYMR